MWTTIFRNTKVPIIVIWGGQGVNAPPPIFFYLRIMFLATELKTGRIKELGKCGEDGCMYINPYPANVENMVSS